MAKGGACFCGQEQSRCQDHREPDATRQRFYEGSALLGFQKDETRVEIEGVTLPSGPACCKNDEVARASRHKGAESFACYRHGKSGVGAIPIRLWKLATFNLARRARADGGARHPPFN